MNLQWLLGVFIYLNVLRNDANAAKILGVFPTAAKSHWIVGSSLMRGLAAEGHQVTMISPYALPQETQNYTDLLLTGFSDEFKQQFEAVNFFDMMHVPSFVGMLHVYGMGFALAEKVLTHPNIVNLMSSGEHFDLVIVEIFCADAIYGLAEYFNAPLVAVATFGSSRWSNKLVGAPAPLSYVPNPFTGLNDRMTFLERFENTAMDLLQITAEWLVFNRKQAALYNRIFPNNKKTMDETIVKGAKLVLLNTHVTLTTARPSVPNMIDVGGMHIDRRTNELPADIKKFLDDAQDGAVYFSMGSIIPATHFPEEKIKELLKAFAGLKQRVLWKFEKPMTAPKNVMLQKWMPQNDILSHPNVKMFITHGGLLGSTEAIYSGVPIVGIPIYGDQRLNVGKAVATGYGLRVDYNNLTSTAISWAVNEIMSNSKYSDAARTISHRYRDQPMAPLQTALYWVDYVLRQNGADHLRVAAQDLSYIEYYMIDVYAAMILIAFALKKAIVWLFMRCKSRPQATKPKSH